MYSVRGGGKISLYTYDNLFQYKIENGVMVKREEEELEEERKKRLENPDYTKITLELKNRLREMGLLENACTSTSIREDFTFKDLIHKTEVTFFTNWIDGTHFPRPIGSGVLLPGADPRFKTILYTTTGFLFNKHLFQTFVCHVFVPEDGQLDEAGKPYEMFYEWTTLSDKQSTSNPNLFINGNFKICQKDMEEYNTNKTDNGGRYYPDRWICARDYNDTGLKYKIEDDGLHACFLNDAGSWGKLQYKFDKDLSHFLSEKIITISGKVKFSNDQIQLKSFELYDGNVVILSYPISKKEEDGIYKVTVKLPKLTSLLVFDTKFLGVTDTEVVFEYLKIELGNEATLFVPPDPAQELVKCKYYYQEIEIISNVHIVNNDRMIAFVPYSPMRTVPKLSFKNNYFNTYDDGVCITDAETGNRIEGFTFKLNNSKNIDCISVNIEKANHGLNKTTCFFMSGRRNKICLSAEL